MKKLINHINRRSFSALSIMMAGLSALPYAGMATAQTVYPTKPITIVVPHAAGGAVDSVARFYANKLREELKDSCISRSCFLSVRQQNEAEPIFCHRVIPEKPFNKRSKLLVFRSAGVRSGNPLKWHLKYILKFKKNA